MTGVMRLDPAGLRRAEPGVTALGGALRQILGELSASLDAEGDCWGTDRFGREFGDGYLPAQAVACEAFAAVHTGVSGVGDALLWAASAAEAAEERTGRRFG